MKVYWFVIVVLIRGMKYIYSKSKLNFLLEGAYMVFSSSGLICDGFLISWVFISFDCSFWVTHI